MKALLQIFVLGFFLSGCTSMLQATSQALSDIGSSGNKKPKIHCDKDLLGGMNCR